MSRTKKQEKFALSDLVWVIGYQLTAYIGPTAAETVAEWLQNGIPEELESRMKAALDVALPIAEVGVQQKLMRHSDISTTAKYGDALMESKRKHNSVVARRALGNE